jgi:hypothetical protein
VVPYSIVRSGDYKLIYYFDGTEPELYDLSKDPMEETNLSKQQTQQVTILKAKLETWWKETGARLPKAR